MEEVVGHIRKAWVRPPILNETLQHFPSRRRPLLTPLLTDVLLCWSCCCGSCWCWALFTRHPFSPVNCSPTGLAVRQSCFWRACVIKCEHQDASQYIGDSPTQTEYLAIFTVLNIQLGQNNIKRAAASVPPVAIRGTAKCTQIIIFLREWKSCLSFLVLFPPTVFD